MLIHDLPNDIPRLILEDIFEDIGGVNSTLSKSAKATLLKVCRRWRQMALPMVYRAVSVSCTVDRASGGKGRLGAGFMPAAIRSNLGLAVSIGCLHVVKEVHLCVWGEASASITLNEAVRFMRATASKLDGVKSLKIWLHVHGRQDGPGATMRAACKAATAVLPNVTTLSFYISNGHHTTPFSSNIYGWLTSLYAGQLEEFNSSGVFPFPCGVDFKRLKRLTLGYADPLDTWMPRVATEALEKLYLRNWPLSQICPAFSPNANTRELSFPRLKKLTLVHVEEIVDNTSTAWRLHLPGLQQLRVDTPNSTRSLLEHTVLPRRMAAISISLEPDALRAVASMTLPAVERLYINITSGIRSDTTALPAANRILSNAKTSKVTQLMIGSRDMVVRPDDITSTTLTQLVIHSAASVDTMLGLVQKLPNLIHLFLSCFVPDVIEADLTVPGPDDEAVLEPFNAKLNDLTLSHQGVWPLGKLTTVVWHLVLRVPTLRHLTVGNGEKLPMEEFVSVYSERYPHLASVKLDLPPFSV